MSGPPERWTFILGTPAQAHGESIEELRLRDPTGADFVAAGGEGFHFTARNEDSERPDVAWDNNVFANLMARLADVPRSTILSLTGPDLYGLKMDYLARFLDQMTAAKERREAMIQAREARAAGRSETPPGGSPTVSSLHDSGAAIRKVSSG